MTMECGCENQIGDVKAVWNPWTKGAWWHVYVEAGTDRVNLKIKRCPKPLQMGCGCIPAADESGAAVQVDGIWLHIVVQHDDAMLFRRCGLDPRDEAPFSTVYKQKSMVSLAQAVAYKIGPR